MNGVERLQAAIDKLERMRTERGYVEVNGWLAQENPGDTGRAWLVPRDDLVPVTNDELIVTLHRTVDAQLAILRDAEAYGDGNGPGHSYESSAASAAVWALALPLADAILGEVES